MELTKKHKIVFWFSFLFAIGIMIATSITFARSPDDFLVFIPGSGGTDFLFLIGVPLVVSMILPLFIPKITPAIIKLMKKFRKSSQIVHIPVEPNSSAKNFLGRALLPVLLMFSKSSEMCKFWKMWDASFPHSSEGMQA